MIRVEQRKKQKSNKWTVDFDVHILTVTATVDNHKYQ